MNKYLCGVLLALVITSCHSRKKNIREIRSADTIKEMGVSVMQRTASDSSSHWSLQQLFSKLSIDIDSIVIMRELECEADKSSETLSEGSALPAVAHHDHPEMAMECSYAGNRLAVGEADTAFKTASIPRPPPGSCTPGKATAATNKSKERIVITGLRISKNNTATVASVTESKDTATEAVAEVVQEKEVSTQEHKVVEKREPVVSAWMKILLAAAAVGAVIWLLSKYILKNKV